ncbi:glycosyltransferase [Comamonas aquatica]|uniref:glycosyltransferase n=1 Tax=Comamonas TaxID=283 RepID=UPI0012ADFD39|nr:MULTISPECIES: glycosyltransferase [Comamonas]MDH1901670.1 glycosyltransferase [Comamonas aquatica]MRT20029.1 glycosyltransferase [Comamonas sp. CAH-2]
MSPSIMRSLQLTKFYPPINGGIETAVRDIADGLSSRQWQVEILCANNRRETVVETGAIPVTRVASWGQVASTSLTPSLITWLRRRQAEHEIVHVHLPNPMANLALWLTRPNALLIVHWHSDIVKQQRLLKLYAPLQNWLLRRADAIIATSPPYAETSPWLKAFAKKVHIVPLCVRDTAALDDAVKRREHAAALRARYPGKKIVFALGRMTYYKGFDVLIDAAALLGDDTVVLIGGSGELLQPLRDKVISAGLSNKVHLLGRLEDADLPAHYEAADLFCLPSLLRSEAFGLVMPEAMALSRPVIATNIVGSGVPWVNAHGESGLNAEPGDPVSLAQVIRQVLDDPALARRLGEGSRRRYEALFTVEKMTDALLGVYEHLLHSPRA